MSAGAARDLSAKLQQDLGQVLDRNCNIARHVLGPAEIAIIMLEAAVMMSRTAAATIANMAEDDTAATSIFDTTIAAIVTQIQGTRADSLTRTMQARKEARS